MQRLTPTQATDANGLRLPHRVAGLFQINNACLIATAKSCNHGFSIHAKGSGCQPPPSYLLSRAQQFSDRKLNWFEMKWFSPRLGIVMTFAGSTLRKTHRTTYHAKVLQLCAAKL